MAKISIFFSFSKCTFLFLFGPFWIPSLFLTLLHEPWALNDLSVCTAAASFFFLSLDGVSEHCFLTLLLSDSSASFEVFDIFSWLTFSNFLRNFLNFDLGVKFWTSIFGFSASNFGPLVTLTFPFLSSIFSHFRLIVSNLTS